MKECKAVAICLDVQAQSAAAKYCDELSRKFQNRYDVRHYLFTAADLENPALQDEAARLGCQADLIMVATRETPMPRHLLTWIEKMLAARHEREGFLVMLSDQLHSRHELILRSLAHRAGLDFITELPPSIGETLPDSPDPYTDRAHEMTGSMSQILQRPPPPSPRLPAS